MLITISITLFIDCYKLAHIIKDTFIHFSLHVVDLSVNMLYKDNTCLILYNYVV